MPRRMSVSMTVVPVRAQSKDVKRRHVDTWRNLQEVEARLMPRPVIGIDPSLTATGVAWSDGTTEVVKWAGRDIDRLVGIYRQVETWCVCDGPLTGARPLVIIEGLSYGSKGSAITGQAELGAVLRLALHHEDIEFLVVPPAVVKKYATGKGNANKDLVRDAARDRLGPLAPGISSDECDALWLRQIGMRLVGDPAVVDVPKLHLTALDKLDLTALVAA